MTPVSAQPKHYTAFTVANGLPSNHIYHCVEDDKGFLWVATDAGIARFDGKHFQVFTTDNGVPDNEVLSVLKEKDGTIWINCFKQSPAYFDEVKNRFINAKEDSNLAKVSGTALMQMFALKEGGVIYYNEKGSYIFKQGKLVNKSNFLLVGGNAELGLEYHGYKKNGMSSVHLVRIENHRATDSINMQLRTADLSIVPDEGNVYMFDFSHRKIYAYSDIRTSTLSYRKDSAIILESSFSISYTPQSIILLTRGAKLYVYDKHTLQLTHLIKGDYLPNGFYDDSKGNLWICTIDKGLLVYRKNQLGSIDLPDNFLGRNFLSIARKQDGALLAGNYYGEVIEARNKIFKVTKVIKRTPSRLKKILLSGDNVYTISDASDGVLVNFTRDLLHPESKMSAGGKTGLVCNDSLILVGTSYGFLRLNTLSQTLYRVVRYNRITSMVKANNEEVYAGSTDGLHKYNFIRDSLTSLTNRHALLGERITSLCTTPDGLLWVSTANNGIVVVRGDSVLLHISTNDGIISNSCRTIISAKKGQVWVGTSHGVSVVDYSLTDKQLLFTLRNITENDGLTSNEINEMVYHNDTVYAATGNGISLIPANSVYPQLNIAVHLVRMSINQRDTVIASQYSLGYQQQNILMQFAGVELNGHFKNMQYALDDSQKWVDLVDNSLTLQLNSGHHTVFVRARDVNGNISNKVLKIHFLIATPFWKSWWFWIMVAVGIQLATIYLVNRRQRIRKEQKLEKELAVVQTASLEQQAFTSLMNPHFMFNALNSIQHYINVQDRKKANHYLSDFASLIRKNFEAAQKSFIPLEQELENIKIYLRLEQMRFTDRFTYDIRVDLCIDTEQWMIPTMMLQPLLENALLHGIMPSTIRGMLIIEIEEKNDNLQIVITDNGIGIENSLAAGRGNDHKSHGMALIQKRINALNHFVKEPIQFVSAPAFQDATNPGNRITILIPGILYEAWQHVQLQKK
jgi:ligand-binding sensor domain-containing protein